MSQSRDERQVERSKNDLDVKEIVIFGREGSAAVKSNAGQVLE
jgi:hypothetical protein